MESYVECNTYFESFTYVTGDEKSALSASAVYTHSSTDQNVYLNKLQAGTTGKYTFLHIGTSDGKLQKVSQIKLNISGLAARIADLTPGPGITMPP